MPARHAVQFTHVESSEKEAQSVDRSENSHSRKRLAAKSAASMKRDG